MGRAMALALASAGHRVLALGHIASDEAELMAQAESEACAERIRYGCMDLRAPGGCDQAVAWARGAWGEVDALINNAGLTLTFVDEQMYTRKTSRRFYESSDEVIRGIYETNVMVPEMLAARLAPGMVERGWGRIINVTTMESTMQRLGFCPYGASKAALELSSMVWAAELKATGVTVNVLNPGGGANTLGIAPEVMRRRVEETLDLLGLAELRNRPLRTLSGGQQQRVAIGAVLTAHPRVLVQIGRAHV